MWPNAPRGGRLCATSSSATTRKWRRRVINRVLKDCRLFICSCPGWHLTLSIVDPTMMTRFIQHGLYYTCLLLHAVASKLINKTSRLIMQCYTYCFRMTAVLENCIRRIMFVFIVYIIIDVLFDCWVFI